MFEEVKVAAISFVPQKFELQANADRLEATFRQAAASGVQLAVAPEGVLEGYVVNEIVAGKVPPARMREVALSVDSPMIRRFRHQLYTNHTVGTFRHICLPSRLTLRAQRRALARVGTLLGDRSSGLPINKLLHLPLR